MILVVDDHAEVRTILRATLQRAGLECALAENGEEAVRRAQELVPELILLDVMMPRMDGFEACRRIRQIEALRDVPIVFLTAVGEEAQMLRGYELGAEDYLVKPVSGPVLLAKLQVALARRRRAKVLSLSDVKPGMVLEGRYRVLRELGRGGMGVVFLIAHAELRTQLALKVLRLDDPGDPKAHERFQREVQTLARLRHPHLIRIHDAGRIGELHYYTMDYLSGGSLFSRLQRDGRLAPAAALRLVAAVSDGVACAHDVGLLHRDLKTDNILFTAAGDPVVTDFGLVLDVHEDRSRLTTRGIILGTPHYMSPEQIRTPRSVDARSDVYALGVLLHEMLTARTPHAELSDMEAMVKTIMEDVPSPRLLVPDLPEAAVGVCLRALSRERDTRYASARELAREALEAARAIAP